MTTPFRVKAVYEYSSEYEDDLNFPVGQIITVTEIEDDEWYSGTYDGKTGMFPKNFVEVCPELAPEPATPAQPAPVPAPQEHNLEPEQESALEQEPEPEQAQSSGDEEPEAAEPEPAPAQKQPPSPPASPPIQATETKAALAPVPAAAVPKLPAAAVPMPGTMPPQRNDSYNINKQFIGAGKSSYVPQVTPRDTSYTVHGHNDVAAGKDVVRASDQVPEESLEPKMSLKERIAMLQQRQQEEAEREAAAKKRKEERKKEKAKAQEKAETERRQSVTSEAPQATESPALESQKTASSVGSAFSHQNTGASFKHVEPEREEIPLVQELNEDQASESSDEEDTKRELPTEQAAEDEDDDQDEEARRRRLVERMAKISGGRSMFGMMGMPNPFQNQQKAKSEAPPPEAKPAAPQAETQPEAVPQIAADASESEQLDQEDPVPSLPRQGVPIPGMVPSQPPTAKESDAGPADSINEKEDIAAMEKPDDIVLGGLPSAETEVQTKDNAEFAHEGELSRSSSASMEILEKSNIEEEVAGYEADADLLDKGAALPSAIPPPSERAPPPESPAAPPPNPHRAPPPIPSALPPSERHGSEPSAASGAPKLAPPVPPIPTATPALKPPPPPVPTSDAAPPPPPHASNATHSLPSPPVARPPQPPQDLRDILNNDHVTRKVSDAEVAPTGPPKRTMPPPPPPPSTAPVPPVPSAPQAVVEDEEGNSSEDEPCDFTLQSPHLRALSGKSNTVPSFGSDAASLLSLRRRSTSGSMRRSSTGYLAKPVEIEGDVSNESRDQAAITSAALRDELSNAGVSSAWWIKSNVPDCLVLKVGVELVCEVDENRLKKRGRHVVYKDYYILFHDLSQILVELQYDEEDPRASVKFNLLRVNGPPQFRKDVLHDLSTRLGRAAAEKALALIGHRSADGVAHDVIEQLQAGSSKLLGPIGVKGYGATIYKNESRGVWKADEIRPGDVLCMKNAKFHTHKGLGGLSSKSVVLGEGSDIYSAIVVEYDAKKDKIKVVESTKAGARKESYKMGELKSGRVRVFRLVDRAAVGW